MEKRNEKSQELGDKIMDMLKGYTVADAALALWTISGGLIAAQGDDKLESLYDEFCKNVRTAAYLYVKYLKENPCTHGGEEDEVGD